MLLLHSLLFQLSGLIVLYAATNQYLMAKSIERPKNGCIDVVFTQFIRPTIGNSHAIQVNLGIQIDTPLQTGILQILHTSNCPIQVMSIWTQLPVTDLRKHSCPMRKISVFMVFVSSIAEVDQTLRHWRTMANWHREARVILIIEALEQPNCAVRRMLELFLAYGMQHVYVVYNAPDISHLAVITWSPVAGDISIQTISVCEYGDNEDEDDAKLKLSTYAIREDKAKDQCISGDSMELDELKVADEQNIEDPDNYEAEWIAIK